MTIADFAFYLFAIVTVAAGLMVTVARNPVHSVLWLILAFLSAAGLMVLLGAEFVAMLLIIVYVGAVAVLFLFVVMMLDVDFAELKQGVLQYLPIGGVIAAIVLAELMFVGGAWTLSPAATKAIGAPIPGNVTNAEALGLVLYTRYIHYFQIAGIVLLVAMIGAIVLTLHHRPNVKRQSIPEQNARSKTTAMEVRKVASGQGLEETAP